MNKLSHAGVLAENMLFATLDPTTRKVRLPKINKNEDSHLVDAGEGEDTEAGIVEEANGSFREAISHNKGQEILLTDTVGFISKLPTNLIAAFR